MKVTVKDCLELPVLKGALVIAGSKGLENRVSAISFLEAGSFGSMKPGMHKKDEMILAASFPETFSEEAQLQLIRSMSESEEAALVLLASEKAAEKWPQNILDFCNEANFPIVVLPEDA